MKLDFQKNPCRFLGYAAREVQNGEMTQELRLSDGMPDIGRTLASWGQVVLRTKQWRSDTVTVSGGVMLWVLYAPEDGSEPRCMEGYIPFQLSWQLSTGDREGPVRITPLLRFLDCRTVSARKFMVRAGVAALGEAMYPREEQIYTPPELPEDVQVLRRLYPIRLPREAGEKTFLIQQPLAFQGETDLPEKILAYTLTNQIQEQKVMGNKVVLRGTGRLHLIYQTPQGIIQTRDFDIPFSQFEDLEGSFSPDAQADVSIAVTSLELEAAEGTLELKCGLVAQYVVSDRELLELTEDAYSPFRTLELQRQELELPAILEDRHQNITAQQSLGDRQGQVIDLSFLPDFPRQRRMGEELTLENTGQFQLLYRDEEQLLQGALSSWEQSEKLPIGEKAAMTVTVQPAEMPRWMERGPDLEVSAELQMGMQTVSRHGLSMVTGLELGELQEPDPMRPSLILSRLDGESLWELAKRCGSTSDSIRQANGLTEEPAADRMLLIPVS